MTDSDSELADAFEEATATAEQVHAGGVDDGLDGDAAETLRDPSERLADALSEASLEELLSVTGFEDAPDDVSPVDLPAVIRDADADAIVELRTLLQLADLGESWSDLSAEERAERVDRAVGDAPTADDGGVALEEYIDRLGHILGGDGTDGDEAATDEAAADEAATDEAATDETSAEEATEDGTDGDESESTVEAVVDAAAEAATGGDSGTEQDDSDADAEQDSGSDGDDELLELEDHVDRLRQLVGDERAADAEADAADADAADANAAAGAEDAEATDVDADAAEADAVDDAEDAEDVADEERTEDSPTQSTAGSRGRLSTIPSSRSDMGKTGRFSTARGKQ